MSLDQRIRDQFAASIATKAAAVDVMSAPIARAIALMVECLEAGNKIMACGNGGSAADSQHFSAELLNRFEREREPLAALFYRRRFGSLPDMHRPAYRAD